MWLAAGKALAMFFLTSGDCFSIRAMASFKYFFKIPQRSMKKDLDSSDKRLTKYWNLTVKISVMVVMMV